MPITVFNKRYVLWVGAGWVELPEDPAGGGLLWQREEFEELGYCPKPVVFGTYGGAHVEVYTQSGQQGPRGGVKSVEEQRKLSVAKLASPLPTATRTAASCSRRRLFTRPFCGNRRKGRGSMH